MFSKGELPKTEPLMHTCIQRKRFTWKTVGGVGGGEDSHMKNPGMIFGKFEYNS